MPIFILYNFKAISLFCWWRANSIIMSKARSTLNDHLYICIYVVYWIEAEISRKLHDIWSILYIECDARVKLIVYLAHKLFAFSRFCRLLCHRLLTWIKLWKNKALFLAICFCYPSRFLQQRNDEIMWIKQSRPADGKNYVKCRWKKTKENCEP